MLFWRKLGPCATVVSPAILMLKEVIMVMVVILVVFSSQEYLRGEGWGSLIIAL